MQMMQYFMDEMMGMGGTPPDPDDPARFSQDYHVDVAALGVDLAAASGAAWVAWVSAEVAGNGKEAGLNDAVGATRLRGLTPSPATAATNPDRSNAPLPWSPLPETETRNPNHSVNTGSGERLPPSACFALNVWRGPRARLFLRVF